MANIDFHQTNILKASTGHHAMGKTMRVRIGRKVKADHKTLAYQYLPSR